MFKFLKKYLTCKNGVKTFDTLSFIISCFSNFMYLFLGNLWFDYYYYFLIYLKINYDTLFVKIMFFKFHVFFLGNHWFDYYFLII